MKRALIFANFDVGLYKFRKELIGRLLADGCEVFISVPDGEMIGPLVEMGCHFIDTPVDRRGIKPATDLRLLLRYRKILKDVRPDFAITYTIKPNLYGGMMCAHLHVPYAINITGLGTAFQRKGALRTLVTLLYRIACRRAGTVFFENAGNLDVFTSNHILKNEKATLLSGAGVNLEEYPFAPYPADGGKIRFLFIGRVMREKGVGELFAAARRIRAEHPETEFHVVGPYEDDYKDEIDRLTKEGVLIYHGYQSDVKLFIRESHCFVLPSWHEGMANTLLECAATGRPLITSRIHGCMEAVEEMRPAAADGKCADTEAGAVGAADAGAGVVGAVVGGEKVGAAGVSSESRDTGNGFLIPVRDTKALVCAIERFLALPYEQKAAMGRRSRELVEQKFDRRVVVEKTVGGLERMLVSRK